MNERVPGPGKNSPFVSTARSNGFVFHPYGFSESFGQLLSFARPIIEVDVDLSIFVEIVHMKFYHALVSISVLLVQSIDLVHSWL